MGRRSRRVAWVARPGSGAVRGCAPARADVDDDGAYRVQANAPAPSGAGAFVWRSCADQNENDSSAVKRFGGA